jgi:hypothetical protein
VPKYTFAFLNGGLVVLLALLSSIAPPDQVTWLRWRVGGIICGILALIALAIQFYLQYRGEQKMKAEQEKRERERDKKIDELLRRIPKRRLTQDAAYTPPLTPPRETLADRVERLAHEYYACLQEGITRSTYESRLKPKLLELLPELKKSPFRVNISEVNIEPTQLYAGMRETADTLALTAAKMENPKMKSMGKFLVLDEE